MNEKRFLLEEVNLHSLAVAILRNLWVVALLCISAVMVYTGIAKVTYEPQYTSYATFMVGAKDSTNAYNSLTTTQNMAMVFGEVFKSNVLRDKVQEQLGSEKFNGTITSATIPETNLLVVSVTSPTPAMSFRSLNLIIENYATISDYVFANAQLEVIKAPAVPMVPTNPLNIKDNYAVVLILSAVLGLAAVVLLSIFRDTVQTPKAARRKLDARMLRIIHHEERNKTLRAKYKRKNEAPLITNPLISKAFIEDNMNLCSAMEYHMRKRGQQVILVTSAGENEGKSTVATNLALAMALRGKRTVLLDCDFRKPSLHKIMEQPQNKERCFSAYLRSGGKLDGEFLVSGKKQNLLLGISCPEQRSLHSILSGQTFAELIDRLRKENDYIILDTPPMLAAADTELLARLADIAVMVVRADFMLTDAVNDCMGKLRKSVPDMAGFVLNNYHKKIFP